MQALQIPFTVAVALTLSLEYGDNLIAAEKEKGHVVEWQSGDNHVLRSKKQTNKVKKDRNKR